MSVQALSIPVLGSLLDDLQKRIDGSIKSAINSAENAALSVEIEAGRQVNIAIENAKLAYQDSLEKTMDRVDATIRQSMEALTSMVQDIQDKNDKTIHEIEANANNWIMALPLAGWQPLLSKAKPHYVVITEAARNSKLHFQGLFKYAGDPKYKPTFVLDGQEYSPINTTNQQLDFDVPLNIGEMNKRSYAVGKLKVPYETGWILSNIKVSEYNLWLGALPFSPGKITAYYTSIKIDQVVKPVVSPTIHARPSDSDYPANWVTKTFTVYPDRGWYVIPSTVKQPIIHKGAHGSWSKPTFKSIDPNQIVTQIGLSAKDGKHTGIVDYHIEFDEVQDIQVKNTRSENVDLQWRGSYVLKLEPGEELSYIAFDAFDGIHYEFAGADTSNPYLKVHFINGKYQLVAEIPDEILDHRIAGLMMDEKAN